MNQWEAGPMRIIRRDVDRACNGSPRRCHQDGPGSHAVHGQGEFVVEAQHDENAVVVALAGEFDLAAAARVRETLTRAMSEPRRRLILDLGEVTFIDSGGLHVILDAYKLCLGRDADPTLTIRPGPPHVQRVFELTNLVDYLPFEIND